jgi:hypothetical protein
MQRQMSWANRSHDHVFLLLVENVDLPKEFKEEGGTKFASDTRFPHIFLLEKTSGFFYIY